MVRTLPSPSATSPRLDTQRILAISFALAAHALALGVLLLPLTQAPLPDLRPERPPERWQVRQPIPVPPLPPTLVQPPHTPTPPHLQTTPTRVQRQAPVETPPIVDQGTEPAEPAADPIGPPDPTPPWDGQPLQGAQLRYAFAPPPSYPRDAARAGIEGRVLLRVLVDVDGWPLQVIVDHSSGNRLLDREATRQVQQRWRFEPATRDGHPVQAWGMVPIDFSLQ